MGKVFRVEGATRDEKTSILATKACFQTGWGAWRIPEAPIMFPVPSSRDPAARPIKDPPARPLT